MSEPKSLWKRPIVRLAAVSFAALFVMAPTPGNAGGCSSTAGSQPVVPGNPAAGETAEYMYFDHGMCAGFCWRLRECEVLCTVLNAAHPSYAAACAPPSCALAGDCGATAWGRVCLPGTNVCGCNTDADCVERRCDTGSHRCHNAGNDSPEAYTMCVRATTTNGITPYVTPEAPGRLFGVSECPHACPRGDDPIAHPLTYRSAYGWDVQACLDAVVSRSCNQSGSGSIGTTFLDGVSECTNVCRCTASGDPCSGDSECCSRLRCNAGRCASAH